MSIALHKRQNGNQGTLDCTNIVLYHSDTPVISVEQGTRFGLIKMLYESIRGYGQIIGLRQRESASTLACIITQDQTILTEREYDIILHAKDDDFANHDDFAVTNSLEYVTTNHGADQKNVKIRVIYPTSSISPSIASMESPERSSYFPSQVDECRPDKRKWQCLYCKKFFVCRSAYENHERTHTGEKPFQCNVCGRCFGHQGNLKQHMHIHRAVKPHVCDVCGRGFTRSNRLRDHKRSHQYEVYMHKVHGKLRKI